MIPNNKIINAILILFCISGNVLAQTVATPPIKCVVIDAGHGGKDPGATNGKLLEKNVTLAVALKLGAKINAAYPNIKVVYTRKTDVFVPLQGRSEIANKADADIFISIHTNAAKNKEAYGTETFLMGVDKSGANMAVAMRENDVITYEADYSTTYQGYEPGSSESFIIFSLMNYAFQTQSLSLASMVQKEFGANLPTKNRGVKQAGYLVLWQTTMPSILTEIGFISHAEESKFLASDAGRDKIASLIAKALGNYINSVRNDNIKVEKTSIVAETPSIVTVKPAAKSVEKTAVVTEPPISVTAKPVAKSNDLTYRILIMESTEKYELTAENFGPFVSIIEQVKDGNLYKYYAQKLVSYKEALLLQGKVIEIFPDAAIIALSGDKQISLDEARKIKP